MEKIYKGSKIVVDCITNDPVDVRCGGPKVLGYDYFVKYEDASELVGVITETLEEMALPIMSIRIEDEGKLRLSEKELWTKKRIITNLIEDSQPVRSEYERRQRNGTFERKV